MVCLLWAMCSPSLLCQLDDVSGKLDSTRKQLAVVTADWQSAQAEVARLQEELETSRSQLSEV